LQVSDGLREGEADGYEGAGEDDGDEMSYVACVGRFEESAEARNGIQEEDRTVEEAIAAEQCRKSEAESR
jgi:hypothetical protein